MTVATNITGNRTNTFPGKQHVFYCDLRPRKLSSLRVAFTSRHFCTQPGNKKRKREEKRRKSCSLFPDFHEMSFLFSKVDLLSNCIHCFICLCPRCAFERIIRRSQSPLLFNINPFVSEGDILFPPSKKFSEALSEKGLGEIAHFSAAAQKVSSRVFLCFTTFDFLFREWGK